MTFSSFRNYLIDNKVSIYNHVKNHLWEHDFDKFYLHVLPSKNPLKPERTRKAQGGAHFFATRYIDTKKGFRPGFVWKKPLYFSKHIEIFDGRYCFVIRKDVLLSLKRVSAAVFFEDTVMGQGYTNFANVHDILKCRDLHESLNQQGVKKVYLPFDLFDFYEKDYSPVASDVQFDPTFLGQFRFHCTVHGVTCNVRVVKQDGTVIASHSFKTLKDMFDMYNLAKKGAKLETIQKLYREQKNFMLDGLTFVFQDNWNIVEYKVRLSAAQKALLEDIKAKEAALAALAPEEELITPIPTPTAVEESEEDTDDYVLYMPSRLATAYPFYMQKDVHCYIGKGDIDDISHDDDTIEFFTPL